MLFALFFMLIQSLVDGMLVSLRANLFAIEERLSLLDYCNVLTLEVERSWSMRRTSPSIATELKTIIA